MSGRFRSLFRRGTRDIDVRVMAALALTSALVILPALHWGIAEINHPHRQHAWGNDDQVPMASLAEIQNSLQGSPPNRNYAYPLGQHLVWGAFYAPLLGWELSTGGMASPSAEFPFGFEDPARSFTRLAWVGRTVTASMAVVAVLAMYAAGLRMGSRAGGSIAALGLLFSWPFLYYARTGNPDAATLMWTCLGLAASVWILRDGYRRAPGIFLGICVAAASATKEQSLGSFFLIVPALLAMALFGRSGRSIAERGADVLWSGAAFALTFVVWHGIWLDPERFVRHIELLVLAGGGGVGGPGYLRHPPGLGGLWLQAVDLGGHLVDAMTWPWLLVSAGGAGWCAFRAPRQLVLLLSAVGFFAMLMLVGFSRVHYVLAIVAVLMLFAGRLLGEGIARPRTRWFALAATALMFVVPVLRAIDLTHDMRHDGRYAAQEWAATKMRPGDRVLYFGAALKLPNFPAQVDYLHVDAAADARAAVERERPEWIVLVPEDTDEERRRVAWRSGAFSVRSAYLPASLYRDLGSGRVGYRLVGRFQSPRLMPWLARPFLSYATVNPPVQILLREDRAAGLPRLEAWTEAPHNPPLGRVNEPEPMAPGDFDE